MKPLHWDQINPFTGTPFTWDDPNLRWGSPSYYLEPGDPGFVPYPGMKWPPEKKKKKKPFRRKKKADQPPPTSNPHILTMSTFKYHVRPNPNGGFTTRPVLGEPISDAMIRTHIATTAGITEEQATAAVVALCEKLRECANGCGWSPNLFGQISFRPTSGGSQPTADAFDNPDEINADIALSFTRETIETWRSTLALESLGTKGLVTPVIDTIMSEENQAEDYYVPGTMIRLIGHDLRFDKSLTTQGVFFIEGDATETRATVYGPITPSAVTVLVPATLSGPLQVKITAHINGSLRTYLYTNPITTS